MTDEHPSWDHRVRALENTKVALDRLRGNQKPTPATPLDAAVVDLAGTAKWSSIADQWYQKFKPTWLTAADEFKAMGEVIEYSRDAALPHSMRALFESIVAHIALDTQDAGEMKAMNDFANILVRCSSREASMNESVQLPNNYGETYGQLEQNYTNQLERQNRKEAQQRTHPLLGDGAVLHLAMETFINPESSLIDRIDAAETIVRIGRENMTEKGNHAFLDLGYYYGRRHYLNPTRDPVKDRRYFPNFEMPDEEDVIDSEEDIIPQWEEHVLQAQSLVSESPEAAQVFWDALHFTGAHHDPRVMKACSPDLKGKSRIVGDKQGQYIDPQAFYWLNELGRFFGHDDMRATYTPYAQQQSVASTYQRAALAAVNWDEMEKDFWNFISVHRDALTPCIMNVDEEAEGFNPFTEKSEAPFVAKFLEKMKAGVEKGTISKDDVRHFFSKSPDLHKKLGHRKFTQENFDEVVKAETDGRFTLDLLYRRRGFSIGVNRDSGAFSLAVNGMHLHDPYMDFILSESSELVPIDTRLAFAKRTNIYDITKSIKLAPRDRLLIDLRRVIDVPKDVSIGTLIDMTQRDDMLGALRSGLFLDSVTYALLGAASGQVEPLTSDQLMTLNDLRTLQMGIERSPGSFVVELMGLIDKESVRYATALKASSTDGERLIDEYISASAGAVGGDVNYSLINLSPKAGDLLEDALQDHLAKVEGTGPRMAIAERLLHPAELPRTVRLMRYDWEKREDIIETYPTHYDAKIHNPELRETLHEAYAQGVAERVGKDDGTTDYAVKLHAAIDDIIARTDAFSAVNIISKVATKVVAQPENAHKIKETLEKHSLSAAFANPMKSMFGEMALEVVAANDKQRIALLDFLTSPLSDQSIDTFSERCRNSEGLKNAFGTHLAFAIAMGQKSTTSSLMIDFHRNLWSLPLEFRAMALDVLLFPAGNLDPDKHTVNMELAQHLATPTGKISRDLKKLLTEANAKTPFTGHATAERPLDSETKANNTEANTVFGAYTKHLPADEQRLLLSAMVAAKVPTEQPSKKLGQVVRQAMSAAGPAGDKLLQAIHSSQDITDEFRHDLGNPKSEASPLQRWQIIELLERENLLSPDHAREHGLPPVVRVGEVLGSGSYGVTVRLIRSDGENTMETAVTLLREHAASRSEREFGAMSTGADELVKINKKYKPVQGMVRQAAASSVIETNMADAKKQGEIGHVLYDGASVVVDGETFIFKPAKWLGEGSGYKETEIIPGLHFNDLPKDSASALERRERIATALLTQEWSIMLRGGHFDHDRHGSQQRIQGNTIGLFDFGGVSLQEMSDPNKALFGRMLAEMVKAQASGKGMGEALKTITRKFSANEESKIFMGSIERTLLAQQDYMSAVKQDRFASVLSSLIESGNIDPIIYASMQNQLGMFGRSRFNDAVEKAPKTIAIHPSPALPDHKRSVESMLQEGNVSLKEIARVEAENSQTLWKGALNTLKAAWQVTLGRLFSGPDKDKNDKNEKTYSRS